MKEAQFTIDPAILKEIEGNDMVTNVNRFIQTIISSDIATDQAVFQCGHVIGNHIKNKCEMKDILNAIKELTEKPVNSDPDILRIAKVHDNVCNAILLIEKL